MADQWPITASETSRRLKVSRAVLRTLLLSHDIPHHRVNRKVTLIGKGAFVRLERLAEKYRQAELATTA